MLGFDNALPNLRGLLHAHHFGQAQDLPLHLVNFCRGWVSQPAGQRGIPLHVSRITFYSIVVASSF